MLAQSQRHRHVLVGLVACGNDVLQIHIGRIAALLHQAQESIKVPRLQRRHLLGHPGVLLVEVDGPQYRPVTAGFPKRRHPGIEVLLVDLGQDLLAELGADRLQFAGDGGVFVGQVRVAGLAVDDAQGMAAGGKVKVHRLDDRMVLVQEIDGHQVAHGGGHLVHQAAGLAEEHVLRVLADHSNLRLGHFAIKEQAVDDGSDQHLVSGGGA